MSLSLSLGLGRARLASAAAPTGPGGIAMSNVKLWLKADALSLTDGTAVSSWTDSGPLAKHATQATGTNQPVYKTGILNGKPCVRFDATNDVLKTAAIDLTDTPNLMVFMVFVMATTGGFRMLYESTAGDAESSVGTIQMYRRPDEFLRILHRGNAGAGSNPQLIDTAVSYTTTARYVTAIYDFTQAGGNELTLRRNGVDVTAGATVVNGGTNNTDTGYGNHILSVGNRGDASFSSVGMDLFELIILKGTNTTERGTVEAYLATKYAL